MESGMRRLRWLLPLAILSIAAAVGSMYWKQRARLAREAPAPPARLAAGIQGQAVDWCYAQSQGERTQVDVCAARFREAGDLMELEGVQIKLFHADGEAYDLVTSDSAQFDTASRTLYSEGEVEITLGVPAGQQPTGRLLSIHSSGVRFSSKTGVAETDRAVRFEFEKGGGSAVGGRYDPAARELRLDGDVSLDWRGEPGQTKPIHIEAGKAWYFERDNKVRLEPWSKLRRESLDIEAGPAEVFLEKGVIRRAEVEAARGVQSQAGRQVEFAAEDLQLHFDEDMLIRTIHAERGARLVSTNAAARTTMRGERVDMEFVPAAGESILRSAIAQGNSVVEAEPVARSEAGDAPDRRVLRSAVIRLAMRAGGEEIERVETGGKATLDLIPSRPGQPRRNVTGDQFWIEYAAHNHLQRFRTINAHTRTERPGRPVMETSSRELVAYFDAAGGLARLEQTADFRYQEGARRATADRAVLEQSQEQITLTGNARASDPTGWVHADTMTLNQKTGDFSAQGSVSSSREPDRKPGSSSMLSADAPLQASAARMTSADQGQRLHYEGSAKAWQGANRVEADHIEIDNQRGVMEAHGSVVTQLYDNKKPPGSQGLTLVRASDLVYLRDARLAHYTGGVVLERPGPNALTVHARELRAVLSEPGSESALERAMAQGAVKIVSATPEASSRSKRIRTATSEQADYDVAQQRVVLTGGQPLLVDSLKGNTRGQKLTWWVNDDRLLVEGEEGQPARSRILKK